MLLVEEIVVNNNNNLATQSCYGMTSAHTKNTHWISIICRDGTMGYLYFKNGIVDQTFIGTSEGLIESTLKYCDKERLDDFITWKSDFDVTYQHGKNYAILEFKEFGEKKMIEYDDNGYLVYSGEYKYDTYNGYYRSGHGYEYKHSYEYVYNQLYYDGNWEMNRKVGYGRCYENGTVYYQGEWDDDLPNGTGEVFNEAGMILKGVWKDGYLPYYNKYYSFESQKLMRVPWMVPIWRQLFVVLVMILSLPFLFTVEENHAFPITSIVSLCYVLLMTYCCYSSSQYANIIALVLVIGYTIFFVLLSYWLYIDSASLIHLLGSISVTELAIRVSCLKRNTSFPFDVSMFKTISKKKASYCIYIEIAIVFISFLMFYCAFYGYTRIRKQSDFDDDVMMLGFCFIINALVITVMMLY